MLLYVDILLGISQRIIMSADPLLSSPRELDRLRVLLLGTQMPQRMPRNGILSD